MPDTSSATEEYFANLLAPGYRLERLLGVGGAASVYLAADLKHERQVAIKVLRRDLLATEGVDRFAREIRMAARLTHPNIVPLLDSGIAGETPYFVMPFIDGESLRGRLEREQRLSATESIALVEEAADALEYAHAAGIVHRDIKPENLLLLRSHAVIADFGIARALTQAATDQRTQSGLVMGTPAYMSPEQASGDGELDGRSDIYSLATVLFEMIAGRPPFVSSTLQGLIGKRFSERAPRLSTLVAGIPAYVDDAIAAALALEPRDRPPTALAFARSLTESPDSPRPRVSLGAHLVPTTTRSFSPVVGETIPSVAVLPFANLSADPENEFLSDGITEEIMSTLSRLRTIRVAARASSFAFKDRRGDVREIAEQLGVTNILDGSVRRAGARVRVAAQLVDARTGFQLWSDRLDRDFDDVFAIQDDIARAIADALSATLLVEKGPAAPREEVSAAAYELYLRGRFALNKRTERDLRAATGFFESAVAAQPSYALAHAGLADALLLLGIYGAEAPTEVLPRARAAAEHALALDPVLGEAHVTLGAVSALHDWQWLTADDEFRRAVALNPRYATAWQWRATNLLLPMGRFDEAREAIERARALDPLSMVIATSVGVVHHLAGDTAGAVAALERARAIDPQFAMSYYFLGGALRDAGDLAGAESAFREAIARSSGSPEMTAGLAQVLAKRGDAAGAGALLQELTVARATRHVSRCLLAQVQIALGAFDAAESELAGAAEGRDPELAYIGVRPAYAPLRGRPRFDALRARIGV